VISDRSFCEDGSLYYPDVIISLIGGKSFSSFFVFLFALFEEFQIEKKILFTFFLCKTKTIENQRVYHKVDVIPYPSIVPEYFADMIVVNGLVWPAMHVEVYSGTNI
jgi:hypothetical protein